MRAHKRSPRFWIDLISVVPYDEILWLMTYNDRRASDDDDAALDDELAADGSGGGGDDSSVSELAGLLKLVRLARLLKLMRVLRANRIMQRWATRISLSFGMQTCIKCLVGTIILAHWSACLIMIVSTMERESGVQRCWLSEMKFAHKTIWARYLGAIYWSVSCLKGTDNDWAVTMAEKMVAVAVMIAGGGVYTIMIGEVANVLSNLDMAGNEYKRTMDNLNQCARARARARGRDAIPAAHARFVRLAFSGTCPTTTLSPSSRSSCARTSCTASRSSARSTTTTRCAR